MGNSPSSLMVYGIKISEDNYEHLSFKDFKFNELNDIIKSIDFENNYFQDSIYYLINSINENILKLHNIKIYYYYSSYLGECDGEIVIGINLEEASVNDFHLDLINFKELINQFNSVNNLFQNNQIIKDLFSDLITLFNSENKLGVYLITSYN